jgi:hypothetical protein
VSKRLDSPYRSGRSPHWIKVKNPKAPAVTREAEEIGGANAASLSSKARGLNSKGAGELGMAAGLALVRQRSRGPQPIMQETTTISSEEIRRRLEIARTIGVPGYDSGAEQLRQNLRQAASKPEPSASSRLEHTKSS